MRNHVWMGTAAAALVLGGLVAGVSDLDGQIRDRARLPLEPIPMRGIAVIPLMEGWYPNEDGSYTISFGYFNANESDTLRVEAGVGSIIEPAEYDGMQPTTFLPGRHNGVFAVTIPAARGEEDVWWRIRNPTGPVSENPGRATSAFYELDHNPKPAGSVPPLMWFDSRENAGIGPEGAMDPVVHRVAVGEPLTVAVNVHDPSVWDAEDPRTRDGVPTMVQWFEHRSPAAVRWERDPAMTVAAGGNLQPTQTLLPDSQGAVSVIATFSQPGDYVLRVRADNFRAPDSSAGNQCCWSNGFVRVTVTP